MGKAIPLRVWTGPYGCRSFRLPEYTGCNRRNRPDFGRVFLMLNYTEKPQNTYIKELNGLGDNGNWKLWTSFGSKNDSCPLEFLSARGTAAGRRVTSPLNIPVWCIVLRTVSISMTRMRGTLQLQLMALCHSQVTLMKSTDINITETTYSCQFQYEFGNQ